VRTRCNEYDQNKTEKKKEEEEIRDLSTFDKRDLDIC